MTLPLNQIIVGDCLEVMKDWPDGCVDLVLTDPPYCNLKGGYDISEIGGGVGIAINKSITIGDEWKASLGWTEEVKRVASLGAMSFCTHHFISELDLAFADWRRVALLTWHKRNAPPTGKNVPRFTSEFIWCWAKTVGLKWDVFTRTVFDILNLNAGCMAHPERLVTGPTKQAVHPTQKPVALMELLCSVLTDGIILDPFCGSGTTCVAAKKLGRNYIGIDISPEYCQIARERLEAVESGVPVLEARKGQMGLFREANKKAPPHGRASEGR